MPVTPRATLSHLDSAGDTHWQHLNKSSNKDSESLFELLFKFPRHCEAVKHRMMHKVTAMIHFIALTVSYSLASDRRSMLNGPMSTKVRVHNHT